MENNNINRNINAKSFMSAVQVTYYKITKIGKGIGLNISIYMANICNICIHNTYVFTSTQVNIISTLTSIVNMKLAVRCAIHGK